MQPEAHTHTQRCKIFLNKKGERQREDTTDISEGFLGMLFSTAPLPQDVFDLPTENRQISLEFLLLAGQTRVLKAGSSRKMTSVKECLHVGLELLEVCEFVPAPSAG